METDAILGHIRAALVRVVRDDIYLLKVRASERAITHRLALYLEAPFRHYNVDCEYNKDLHDPKRVNLPREDDPGASDFRSVYPDVIVHRRGTNENLVIIEAKKDKDRRGESGAARDRQKLEAYYADLSYRVGVFVTFGVGEVSDLRLGADTLIEGRWEHNWIGS